MKDHAMHCDNCGWHGMASEVDGDPERPIAELCPLCGSDDVWEDEEHGH